MHLLAIGVRDADEREMVLGDLQEEWTAPRRAAWRAREVLPSSALAIARTLSRVARPRQPRAGDSE